MANPLKHTDLNQFSFLRSINADYIEAMYEEYIKNPENIEPSWRALFDGMQIGESIAIENVAQVLEDYLNEVLSKNLSDTNVSLSSSQEGLKLSLDQDVFEHLQAELAVLSLIHNYRRYGVYAANLDPLSTDELKTHPELELQNISQDTRIFNRNFVLTQNHLDQKFNAATYIGFPGPASLREIIEKCRRIYCGHIGIELTHISDKQIQDWIRREVEKEEWLKFTVEEKKQIYKKISEAENFENFLHTRFVAKKRFSAEGGEAVVPMLDTIIDTLSSDGGTDLVLGMAHRGRLNVLANIFGKKYEYIFDEFYNILSVKEDQGSGDVKYHMGYSCDYTSFSGKKLHLSLASNPSHLEFVNPVVEGMAKAKQRRAVAYWNKSDEQAKKEVIPILIHGDAAFSGQGICYETVQLSKVKGFNCGGTVHIIINNQIGFTTDWKDSRSTAFASDMIKMIDAPVFHVNGDDLEAVCAVGRLASKIRQKFNIDVMIDLVCYRKYGHNEGDEPSFTQPLMYKKIKSKLSPKKIYEQKLLAEKVTSQDYFETINQQINEKLQKSYEISKEKKTDSGHVVSVYQGAWYGYRSAKDEDFEKSISTGVNAETLKNLAKKIFTPPQDFNVHPKLKKLLELRLNQVIEGKNIEWGVGELLAYASLIQEGSHVRLTGQDAERGTFSHRHAVLTDYENGRKLNLLNDINPKLGFSVYNSILSEAACLGFEYGFASADPTSLTIWEAQFGDFANGAQVIIDQFISSAETKWQRMNGVVLLLPHGFEGQGPEHSSARLERFLQLCAENNIQVCNLTLPSQIFHVLRRQVKREFRKPLIIMSPKKLLRLEAAVSSLSEFIEGTRFLEVIDDVRKNYEARKLIFCTGKVYYELQEVMQLKNIQDIAVVRIEQLYPFPKNQIQNLLKQYSKVKEYIWLQEEPKNQGAWSFVRDVFEEFYNLRLKYVGRQPSAAPACGSEEKSKKEQEILLNEAINL